MLAHLRVRAGSRVLLSKPNNWAEPVVIGALTGLEPASESADGNRWMFFRTEDGQEGWVLELLVVPYQP